MCLATENPTTQKATNLSAPHIPLCIYIYMASLCYGMWVVHAHDDGGELWNLRSEQDRRQEAFELCKLALEGRGLFADLRSADGYSQHKQMATTTRLHTNLFECVWAISEYRWPLPTSQPQTPKDIDFNVALFTQFFPPKPPPPKKKDIDWNHTFSKTDLR